MEIEVTSPQEILTQLEEVTQSLTGEVQDLASDEVDFTPGEGEWSVKQIMAHLQDAEQIFHQRLQKMLNEDEPFLRAFNPDELAEENDYKAKVWADVLAGFEAARHSNLELLKSLQPVQWYKAGIHQERGHITIRDVAQSLVSHSETHLEQVRHVSWLAK